MIYSVDPCDYDMFDGFGNLVEGATAYDKIKILTDYGEFVQFERKYVRSWMLQRPREAKLDIDRAKKIIFGGFWPKLI